ncbi:hypothetical protein V8C42DRAFT_164004 [Trichoderma barbatum]
MLRISAEGDSLFCNWLQRFVIVSHCFTRPRLDFLLVPSKQSFGVELKVFQPPYGDSRVPELRPVAPRSGAARSELLKERHAWIRIKSSGLFQTTHSCLCLCHIVML